MGCRVCKRGAEMWARKDNITSRPPCRQAPASPPQSPHQPPLHPQCSGGVSQVWPGEPAGQTISSSSCRAVACLRRHPGHPPDRLLFLRAISSNSLLPSGFFAKAARSSYRSLQQAAAEEEAKRESQLVSPGNHHMLGSLGWEPKCHACKPQAGGEVSLAERGHRQHVTEAPHQFAVQPRGLDVAEVSSAKATAPRGAPPPLLSQCHPMCTLPATRPCSPCCTAAAMAHRLGFGGGAAAAGMTPGLSVWLSAMNCRTLAATSGVTRLCCTSVSRM